MAIPVFTSVVAAQRYINAIPDGESRRITIKGLPMILDNINVSNGTKFISDNKLAEMEAEAAKGKSP